MNTQVEPLNSSISSIYKAHSRLKNSVIENLVKGFQEHFEDDGVKRTHLFNGRYENIYLNETHIPALKPLVEEACGYARDITGIDELRAGHWFNHMPPGAVTMPHCHDDDDEMLSAVFYLQVPPNSGDLLIHAEHGRIKITPETGLYVFFKPDVVHEVTANNSGQHRLSLALNFGRIDKQALSTDKQALS